MCGGGGGRSRSQRRRNQRRMQQQIAQMAAQQQAASQARRLAEQRAAEAQRRANAIANRPVGRPDEALQGGAFGGTTVRRKRAIASTRKGQASKTNRFSIALNMGGYRGRGGGAPNV